MQLKTCIWFLVPATLPKTAFLLKIMALKYVAVNLAMNNK